MSFTATKKLLAEVMAGRLPDEAAARVARAELAAAERAPVAIDVVPLEAPPPNRVSAEEAIICLGDLFRVFESTLLSLRQRAGTSVVIDSTSADAFINARKLLEKAGYETVAGRRNELIKLRNLAVLSKPRLNPQQP